MGGVVVRVGEEVEPIEDRDVVEPRVGGPVGGEPFAGEPVVEDPRPVGGGVGRRVGGGIVAGRRRHRDEEDVGMGGEDVLQRPIDVPAVRVRPPGVAVFPVRRLVVGDRLGGAERIARRGPGGLYVADRVAGLEHHDPVEAVGAPMRADRVEVVVEPPDPVVHVRVVPRNPRQGVGPAGRGGEVGPVVDVVALVDVDLGREGGLEPIVEPVLPAGVMDEDEVVGKGGSSQKSRPGGQGGEKGGIWPAPEHDGHYR